MKTTTQETIAVNANGHNNGLAGEYTHWVDEALFSLLIAGEETQGKLTLLETVQRKGYEPAHHSHAETDQTFYIMAGAMTFYVEGEAIAAQAGTAVFIERGKVHTFTVETETASTLIAFTPAVSYDVYKKEVTLEGRH